MVEAAAAGTSGGRRQAPAAPAAHARAAGSRHRRVRRRAHWSAAGWRVVCAACCCIWLTASTACVRELTPSARSTAATWSLTVSTETFSSRAISLFGLPCSSSAEHVALARRQADRLQRIGVPSGSRESRAGVPTGRITSGTVSPSARRRVQPQHHRRHVQPAGHDHAQRVEEHVVGRALGHEAHRAQVDGADDVAGAVGGRHHHHRQRRVGGAKLGQHLEAVGVAERQVEQHQVEIGVLLQRGARLGGAARAEHGDIVAQPLDHRLQRRQDQRMVIDQQHLHLVVSRHA